MIKEFVLVILYGSSTTANGPAVIDGFKSKNACQIAGERIVAAMGEKFHPSSTLNLTAKIRCVEISKE